MSRVDLGFPHDLLGIPGADKVLYGSTRSQIDVTNPVQRLASGR